MLLGCLESAVSFRRSIVSAHTEALLFNAVPLLALAVLYLGITVALAPLVWEARGRASGLELAYFSLFPAVGVITALLGVLVLVNRTPLGGDVWVSFATTLVAYLPPAALLLRWRDRARFVAASFRAREAEERASALEGSIGSVADVSRVFARAQDDRAVAGTLIDEAVSLLEVDLALLAVVDEQRREAQGLLGRRGQEVLDWWPRTRIDLDREATAIAKVIEDCGPFAVEDVESSPIVGRRIAEATGAKSAAFVPLIVDRRVVAVLAVGTTEQPRVFEEDELGVLQAVAGEAALALDRVRSASELARALERERLVARIARKVRSELDLDAVLEVAVRETGKALSVSRCFVRIGEPEALMPVEAQWSAEGFEPLDAGAAENLAVSNLAARERRTVACNDVEADRALEDPILGGRETLLSVGTRAVLATPIVIFDRMVGIFALHRPEPWLWSEEEVALAQSVAHEVGLAIHTARLLRENEERLTRLSSLLEERERRARLERGFSRIASVLAQTLSLAETLNGLAEAACDVLGADFAAVLMPEETGFRLAGGHDLPPELTDALRKGLPESASALAVCAHQGQVLAAKDVEHDERFGESWRALARNRYRALLAVPVETGRDGERALALLFFADVRAVVDDDLELGRHLADAAKGALERSDLFERERSSRALSQQLARTGSLLVRGLDPDRVLDEVVRQVPRLLEVEASAIHVLDDDELIVQAAQGPEASAAVGFASASSGGLAGEVVQTRAPAVSDNVPDDDPGRDADPFLEAGYRAVLGVPVLGSEGGLLGVLTAYAKTARRWREEEVEALVALAGNAAAALSNAELYQRVALEKERSDAILANVADGIVAVDRDDRVVLWNPAAERITGVPHEEAIDRTISEVLKRNLASDTGGSRTLSIPRGGEEVWLTVSETVMRDAAGEVAGRVFTFSDVSTERLVEQMKSDFVSTVSHQLRAPLTSIYGFAETLLRNDVLFGEEERRTFLRYVVTESERLASIVDTLLNVAQLEAGDLEVDLAPTDVNAVVSEAVESMQRSLSGNGYEFVVDLPGEPLAAEADREKLRQVLANLLDNAVKFSPGGGRVTVSARRNGDSETVEIEVADQGIGIPHAEQALIFSKFYRRPDWAGQEGVGAGLGLFIAQGLVSAMGGDMRVSSSKGRGSRFVFELPLAAEVET
jgi:two-component system phosphate regulon sensor histidine kinase PhoR